MDLEVLVTTMFQNDMSKYKEMNLQTNAIIANQTDFNKFEEKTINGKEAKMISTKTRVLSKNRNIGLALSDAKYILFADDDMTLVNDYEKIIENEFKKHPEAEAIKFFVESNKEGRKLSWKKPKEFKKAKRRTVSSAGIPGLVINQKKLKEKNIFFNENFGTGTKNYCGEDTIFLQELINKKIKFYVSPTKISDIMQGESSWFEGYNEKFFITTGKVLKTIYPRLSYIIVIRSAYRFSKREKCKMKFLEILKCYYKGIRDNEKY